MKGITIDNQKYLIPTWEELDGLCFQLAKQIMDKNEKYARLITLIKGGLAFSRTICDYLNIKNLSTMQISYYEDIEKTKEKPIILQKLPLNISGENILLFDDVIDTGHSLQVALDYLKSQNPKSITLVSLFLKEKSIIKPDYFGAQTDAWIVFPNETRETIELLSKKWQKAGKTNEEIYHSLLSLGFPKTRIDFYHQSLIALSLFPSKLWPLNHS